MEAILEFLEKDVIYGLANAGAVIAEFIGIVILFLSLLHGLKVCFKRDASVRLHLAKGISIALEFMLAGEVFKTIVAATWQQAAMVGAIIVLRVALTFLLHWEISEEEKSEKELEAEGED